VLGSGRYCSRFCNESPKVRNGLNSMKLHQYPIPKLENMSAEIIIPNAICHRECFRETVTHQTAPAG
jgi:hypothetical protein